MIWPCFVLLFVINARYFYILGPPLDAMGPHFYRKARFSIIWGPIIHDWEPLYVLQFVIKRAICSILGPPLNGMGPPLDAMGPHYDSKVHLFDDVMPILNIIW